MKKVVFGGMLFIAGAIMYSIGVLGYAGVEFVRAEQMQVPQVIGILIMVIGAILGICGMFSKD